MNRYGSDKPDTRFGMEIQDISETVKDIDFVVFKSALESGGSVRAINVKNGAETYTRKEIDKLTEHAKGIGAKGLAYIRWADSEPNCSFKKFLGDGDLENICSTVDAQQGDLVLICADKNKTVLSVLGALRLIAGKRLNVIPDDKYNFLWITEMPFFEYDDESNKWVAAHHPFTMPMEECLEYLDTDPANVRAENVRGSRHDRR
jgi:aspartyl-tRNA synthetase